MSNTIYAAFNDAALAEKAAGALLDNGVRAEDISVVRRDGMDGEATSTTYGTVETTTIGTTDAYVNRPSDYTSTQVNIDNPGGYSGGQAVSDISAADANSGYADTSDRIDDANDPDYQANVEDREDKDWESSAKKGISTTTGADAGSGAMKGAAIGLGVGALAALASIFIPGVGLVMGGGALAAALGGAAGTTAAGAAAGAVTGYLKDQGVDAQVASDYDAAIQNGGALLAVTVPSNDIDEGRVQEILSKYGAANVNSYASRGYMA